MEAGKLVGVGGFMSRIHRGLKVFSAWKGAQSYKGQHLHSLVKERREGQAHTLGRVNFFNTQRLIAFLVVLAKPY